MCFGILNIETDRGAGLSVATKYFEFDLGSDQFFIGRGRDILPSQQQKAKQTERRFECRTSFCKLSRGVVYKSIISGVNKGRVCSVLSLGQQEGIQSEAFVSFLRAFLSASGFVSRI